MMALFLRKFRRVSRRYLATSFVFIIFWCFMLQYLPRLLKRFHNSQSEFEMLDVLHLKNEISSEYAVDDENQGMHIHNCKLTEEEEQIYPDCSERIKVLMEKWVYKLRNDSYFPDGSMCYIVSYLINVEKRCPKIVWRGYTDKENQSEGNSSLSLNGLFRLFANPSKKGNYGFIRMRIQDFWDTWLLSIKNLRHKQNMENRRKKKILLHSGLLSIDYFTKRQFTDGPIGELIQWSDLVACLYLLGHHVVVTSELGQIKTLLLSYQKRSREKNEDLPIDILYTDVIGWKQIKEFTSADFQEKIICILRIVDQFGTEPAYNNPTYAKKHNILTTSGGLGLHPQQFVTMFPHGPDNSFLGFVVRHFQNSSHGKRDQAVLYSKEVSNLSKVKNKYLDIAKKYVEINATVYSGNEYNLLPKYTQNSGILRWRDFQYLLQESKIFLGLGLPMEGPAPLEAIANGCVFINPKLKPPVTYGDKPTSRKITSQHPYAEDMIGEPHVYTINIDDPDEMDETISNIMKNNKFEPFLPYEFTEEGMLQRINAYVEHQNFCSSKNVSKWPPKRSIKFFIGEAGKSCKNFCWSMGRVCEPSYFPEANSEDTLKQLGEIHEYRNISSEIYYPACDIKSDVCKQQKEETLYSCVGEHPTLRRICPCRDFKDGQMAICADCTS